MIESGFRVTAIEPAAAMAALLGAKVGSHAEVVVGRLEETALAGPSDLVAAFNSWHWVDPAHGLQRLVEALGPGGVVAFVWTEVISWGQDPFADRLTDLSGGASEGRMAQGINSKDAAESDHEIQTLINDEFGGTITKVEEATVYACRRL